MVEMAPDFTSDSPADWKPSGQFDGAVFLGQVLTPTGQVFKRSFLREAMRLLRPVDPGIRVMRALSMGTEAGLVSGMSRPIASDFIRLLVLEWFADINAQSRRLEQPTKVFLTWRDETSNNDGAVTPLQPPHCDCWFCAGRPDGVEGAWALSYRS